MVEDAHDSVTQLLSDHRDQLESLARALLKAETLDAAEAYGAAGAKMRDAELQPQPT
jgi:ATP-dependent Zn protease